ncbi:MAG: tetratricopeptide repeat protein [Truepera sp.]|nr:tetratricopeptide repeat protein [Truepera sp.]
MNTTIRRLSRILGILVLTSLAYAQESSINASTLIQDGDLYLRQGDCQLAQYFFQEALKLDEVNAEAMVGKGRALACQGNHQLAAEEFSRAIGEDPENLSAYVQLSLAYMNQFVKDAIRFPNRLNDALTVIERAESFAPRSPQVLNTKGVVLYQFGNLPEARDTLLEAAELATQSDSDLTSAEQSRVLVNLGRTYRDTDELELAASTLRKAVMLNPTNATARNNLGNVYFRLQPRNCYDAEYELAQAASLAPTSLSAVSQLAIVTFECGNVAASVRHFERAVGMDSAVLTPPLYTYLARAYMELGRFDDAVKRAQQGALLPPESAEAYYYLGLAYRSRANSGDLDAARRAFERALEIDPEFQLAEEALSNL